MKPSNAGKNLERIEALMEFFKKALSERLLMKNILITGKENPNLRLWALRENTGLSEKEFAELLGISLEEYMKYEFQGNRIPEEILNKICKRFFIKKNWLKCKVPFFPIGGKKKKS